jgi:hypothetical protein
MNLEGFQDKDIEVEAQFIDARTHKPIIKFYHGKLESFDGDSIRLLDLKSGEMVISRKCILKVRSMSPIQKNLVVSKFDTIEDMLGLNINSDINKDVKTLDKKLNKFRQTL